MKVLVGVDGSDGSFDAVSQVAGVLSSGKDEIALYCSPPEIRLTSQSTSPEVLARARQALAQAIFEEARTRLPETFAGSAHTIVGIQDPRDGIVLAAEQWSADLITVGARGLGAFERLLLGSVSRAVVHGAKVPVWVARPSRAAKSDGVRVLMTCQNPERGQPEAEVLSRFTWPPGTSFRTLSVIPPKFAGRVPSWLKHKTRSPEVVAMVETWQREYDEEVRASVARMQDFCRDLPPPCQGSQALVEQGEPAAEIMKVIAREKIDLVVTGVKRKRAISELILGSTSEAVLNHAECSVLLVPMRENC